MFTSDRGDSHVLQILDIVLYNGLARQGHFTCIYSFGSCDCVELCTVIVSGFNFIFHSDTCLVVDF